MILKENEVLRCPRCGGKTFCATAHVTQDWELDDSGTFVRCLNDCVEVTHEPDREDVWDCKTCGYSDAGEKFVTTVGEDSEIRLCECVYDLSALAAQMLGSNGAEIDSRDLFHHILNWSREFEEGGFEHEDYMTAVIEFGKLKIAEYKEGLAQSLEAEEAEEPEKPTPTDAELTFALVSAAPKATNARTRWFRFTIWSSSATSASSPRGSCNRPSSYTEPVTPPAFDMRCWTHRCIGI